MISRIVCLFLIVCQVESLNLFNANPNQLADNDGVIHFEGEKHFENVRQLTFGGANAEAYFSFDNTKITFQASGGNYGTDCDQIYEMVLDNPQPIRRISTGIGATTCSFFFNDNKHRLYAGTFLSNQPSNKWPSSTCPIKQCDPKNPKLKTDKKLSEICKRTDLYIWNVFPSYDIFLVNEFGNIVKQLTDSPGYDAEAVLSPDGKTILFTSKRDGDLNLYLMNTDGTNVRQITHELGYDGGGFFSPDGKKIVYRASRPKTTDDIQLYKDLLSYDMVQPVAMELFVYNLETKQSKQISNLGGANWAPYYLNDNKRIIFSSDHAETKAFGAFSLYVIGEDGLNVEKVTYAEGFFDSFPMMSYDGKQLIWGSSRNSSKYDINLFIADWVDKDNKNDIIETTTGNGSQNNRLISIIAILCFVLLHSLL